MCWDENHLKFVSRRYFQTSIGLLGPEVLCLHPSTKRKLEIYGLTKWVPKTMSMTICLKVRKHRGQERTFLSCNAAVNRRLVLWIVLDLETLKNRVNQNLGLRPISNPLPHPLDFVQFSLRMQ